MLKGGYQSHPNVMPQIRTPLDGWMAVREDERYESSDLWLMRLMINGTLTFYL